ncbi:MAG: DUF4402 domain-containing protein [Syntrophomonadaceae bacterium]
MKNSFSRIVLVGSLVLISAGASFAQTTANQKAAASATIIQPITLNKTTDLEFGIVVPGATPGTVTVGYDGSRASGGGASLLAGNPGSIGSAHFDATGQPNSAYTISIPVSVTITNTGGAGETMTVDNFVSDPGAGTATFGVAGTQLIRVGARLNVGTNQVAGVYTNATGVDVTINYN